MWMNCLTQYLHDPFYLTAPPVIGLSGCETATHICCDFLAMIK